MPATPLYAALLALLFVALSVRTLRLRRRLRIPLGDGGAEQMVRAMRVHANFAEYTPLTLLCLFMLELQHVPLVAINALGTALVLGRLLHAHGVSAAPEWP
jgi:uncharacterized membrane protein YecN with MAPEG domain